jgi:hypothetical protein
MVNGTYSFFFAQEYFVQWRGLQNTLSPSNLMIFWLFLIVRSVLLERFLNFWEALMAWLLYKEGIYALFLPLAHVYCVLFESNYAMRYSILLETTWYCSLILLMNFRYYFLVDLLS